MGISRVLAVGPSCPSELLRELALVSELFDAFDVINTLACCEEYYVTVVKTKASNRKAVVKTYWKSRLSDTTKDQVCIPKRM
jgi:hypothetical protein